MTAYTVDYVSTRGPWRLLDCAVCGGPTEPQALHPALLASDGDSATHFCRECWEAGPARWPGIMEERADRLAAAVANLRRFAGELEAAPPQLPALPLRDVHDLCLIEAYVADGPDNLGDGDPSLDAGLEVFARRRAEAWHDDELGPLGRRVAARLVGDRALCEAFAAAWQERPRRWADLVLTLPPEIRALIAEDEPERREAAPSEPGRRSSRLFPEKWCYHRRDAWEAEDHMLARAARDPDAPKDEAGRPIPTPGEMAMFYSLDLEIGQYAGHWGKQHAGHWGEQDAEDCPPLADSAAFPCYACAWALPPGVKPDWATCTLAAHFSKAGEWVQVDLACEVCGFTHQERWK